MPTHCYVLPHYAFVHCVFEKHVLPHVFGILKEVQREQSYLDIGRVILKYISDSYLFGEKSDFIDR